MTEQEKTLEAIAELQRQLALKEAADNAALDGSEPVEVAPTMDFVTRARLLAQGATLGFADELIARARSLSPNVTYDEAVADERSALEKSKEQFPVQSIAYEIGGALIPGLLAAPFTAGTSLAPAAARATALGAARVAPRVVRAAGVGAAEGAVYAVGAGDEKATKSDVFSDALTGAVVNPAAQKAFQLAAGTLKAVVRPFFKGKRAKAVEDEVMRIVSATGEPVEVIIDRVRNGEIIADMSDVVAEDFEVFTRRAAKAHKLSTIGFEIEVVGLEMKLLVSYKETWLLTPPKAISRWLSIPKQKIWKKQRAMLMTQYLLILCLWDKIQQLLFHLLSEMPCKIFHN